MEAVQSFTSPPTSGQVINFSQSGNSTEDSAAEDSHSMLYPAEDVSEADGVGVISDTQRLF